MARTGGQELVTSPAFPGAVPDSEQFRSTSQVWVTHRIALRGTTDRGSPLAEVRVLGGLRGRGWMAVLRAPTTVEVSWPVVWCCAPGDDRGRWREGRA